MPTMAHGASGMLTVAWRRPEETGYDGWLGVMNVTESLAVGLWWTTLRNAEPDCLAMRAQSRLLQPEGECHRAVRFDSIGQNPMCR